MHFGNCSTNAAATAPPSARLKFSVPILQGASWQKSAGLLAKSVTPALIAGKRLMNHVRPTRKSRDMSCRSGLIALKMIIISFSQDVGDMRNRNEKRVGCFNG